VRLEAVTAFLSDPSLNRNGTQLLMALQTTPGADFTIRVVSLAHLGAGLDSLTGAADGSSRHPKWSPDGQRIAFASTKDTGVDEIWVMDADGSNKRRITFGGGQDPAWSPDGSKIAFARTLAGGNQEIFWTFVDVPGAPATQVTFDAARADFAPSWSPCGTRIVFSTKRIDGSDRGDLVVIRPDGSGRHALTHSPQILDGEADWGYPL
jgi:TolB protein